MPPLVVPHEILDQDIVSRKPDDGGSTTIPDNESVQFLSIKLSGDSSEPLLLFWQSHILVQSAYEEIYPLIRQHSVVLGQPGIGLSLNSSAGSLP